jgi:hypothetical protein
VSKSRRQRAAAARRTSRRPVDDPHAAVILDSLGGLVSAMSDLVAEPDPVQAANYRLDNIVNGLASEFAGHEPVRLIEIARLRCLPWNFQPIEDREGGATRAELLTLLALTASSPTSPLNLRDQQRDADASGHAAATLDPQREESTSGELQPLTDLVYRAVDQIDEILRLAQARAVLAAERAEPIDMIAARMRGTEVWMRNTSYPDRVRETVRTLFVDDVVAEFLRSNIGFDAGRAIHVLEACHVMQVARMNERMVTFRDEMAQLMQSTAGAQGLAPAQRAEAGEVWNTFWDPTVAAASILPADIAASASLPLGTVEAILDYFTLDTGDWTPHVAVDEFASGNNPLRTSPVVRGPGGRALLVHDAHILTAVREGLEQFLKPTPIWDRYQAIRGKLLESRTKSALERVLPAAEAHHGFLYYIPNNDLEADETPNGYTKRVEGDHLVLIDDVALIVEDKAVAVSPSSRAGETRRLRSDLMRVLTAADEQAGRLRRCIERDKGFRLDEGGWLDLSVIREIHTIAVSLDDLPGTSTTTADLVSAGLLDSESMTWTVSLHDLDLITELVDTPAEFLLYLRRRRDPLATVMYMAPDELDLFLYFLDDGLYVEPNPDRIREIFPNWPPPTREERQRYRRQAPTLIASRTDELDAWHDAQTSESGSPAQAGITNAPEKPAMTPSPLAELIRSLEERGDFAWLSTGATLLSGATEFQQHIARIPRYLLDNPKPGSNGRSLAIPLATTEKDGWLLVWMTRPAARKPDEFRDFVLSYLQAKKYQLALPRSVGFVYDQATRTLDDVIYDAYDGDLSSEVQQRVDQLLPADMFNASLEALATSKVTRSRNKSTRRSRKKRR